MGINTINIPTLKFLFSAHISYRKGKYLNQTGFFLQNLPRNIVYVIWRSTFTEFNWHQFSSMRYVFVKIFGLFWEWRKWPHNDPKMTPKMTKIQNFPNFHRFRAFLPFFRWTSSIRMLKTFNKARIRCPIVFWRDTCVFLKEKLPKKWQKFQIFLTFNVLMQFLSFFR